MKTVFFILGMHRSGTSALGGTLNLLGLEFGSELMDADKGNPKGYFENNFIYKLNEKILNESGSAWDDYRFDTSIIDKSKKELYKKEAKEIIESEFRYAKNFAIKDPRICLLFPFWEEVCLELSIVVKVIIPYRNPIEVAASLKKRNNFSYEKSLILWSKHFLSAEYFSRSYERIFTSFDDLILDTDGIVKLLETFTNLQAPVSVQKKIKNEFLDNSVKHNNISLENFTQETPLFLQKILHVIKEKNFEEIKLDEIRKEFLFSLEFFQHKEIFDPIDKLYQENIMLDQIKDVTKVDIHYYLEKYPDIRISGIEPLEHFMRYGKPEGRFPNKYCENKELDTTQISSSSEVVFIKTQELKTQKTEFEENYNQKLQEIAQLNTNLDEIVNELAGIKEAKAQQKEMLESQIAQITEELQTQKTEFEENYNQKLQEIAQLNTNLDEIVNELAGIKEAKAQQKEMLESQIAQITEDLQTIVQENTQKTQELEQRAQSIQELQTQKTEFEENYNQKLQEIAQLNTNLDEIVNDLASIKECKCWTYTKPIRVLQKALKGSNDV